MPIPNADDIARRLDHIQELTDELAKARDDAVDRGTHPSRNPGAEALGPVA